MHASVKSVVVRPSFRIHHLAPRTRHVAPTRQTQSHATGMTDQLIHMSYFVGKSITLFTFFFCSLNWLHYKEINGKDEEDQE